MIIRNFYKDKNERLKLRKRYRIKQMIQNSKEKKYVIYVFRSNKHFYITFLDNGKIHVAANTVKHKKNSVDKQCKRHMLLNTVVKEFFEKLIVFLNKETVNISQFLFDISYYRYSGSVKKSIDYFRELMQNKCK